MANDIVTDEDRAEGQAKAQMASIKAMMERLEHARECDNDEDCALTLMAETFIQDEQIEDYHDEDAAAEAIQEDPLSVQVRSAWHTPGDNDPDNGEYEILLCTGGPACRIRGDLGNYNEPETAKLEYQDWGTPWTDYRETTDEEDKLLLAYCQTFYFGD